MSDAGLFANALAVIGAFVAIVGGGYLLDWLKAKRDN